MTRPEGNRAKHADNTGKGPWKSWSKRMSRHGRAIKFITTYCIVPKGEGAGKPMRLAGFQKELLEECLADGISSAVTSFPRGNGKSTLGAAVATWGLFDDDETGTPQVPIVATKITQAIRSVYGVADRMIAKSPELASRSIVYTGISQPRIVAPWNGGEMFPIANDVDGLQGLDPSLAIFDEIGFQDIESWDALQLATGKRGRELIWGMGTPGVDHDNALFHLKSVVEQGEHIPGFVYREWAAEPNCDVLDRAQWRRANPALRAGFLRMSALVTASALILKGKEAEFRIFRLGQWVDGYESWLGSDGRAVWRKLLSPWALVPGAPSWVGIDVGIKRDSTAVNIVQRRPADGKHPERLHSRNKLWLPTKADAVDVTDVMGYIRELATTYKVGAVSFDPRFFDVPAKTLYDEGIPMVEIPQSVERMTPIIGELFGRIVKETISHDDDPGFEQQVLNAVTRLNDRGFTLAKGKSRGRIDAAIALALAVDRADHQPKPRGGLVVR